MTDLSQPWCIIPTETDCATQVPPVQVADKPNPESMTALTTTFTEGERDEVYYWETVQFLVGGCIFKVPRYQFVVGSAYFTKKLGPSRLSEGQADDAPITLDLEGVTAPQFRVFLKLLFPIHTTSATLNFTKAEWLIILELSTLWHFHEFRKLAKEHLEPQLDDPIEQIVLGRAAYVPKWLSDGYETLVARPECISEKESERIGHLTTVRLYILRHERALDSVTSRFYEEIHELERKEKDHRTSEERLRAAEEARIAQELAAEEAERNRRRLAAETEAEQQPLVAEEAAHTKEQEDEATGSREEVRVEQELADARNQSEVDLASAGSVDHPGEPEIPPQVESYLAALTMAPVTLEPERGDGEEDADARSELGAKTEPVASAYTEVSPDIEQRLQTTLLRRAQKIELQEQLKELKAKGEDCAAIENAEKVLSEVNEKIQKMYEEGRKNYMYWERVPEHITLRIMPTAEAIERVREGILLHLTPDCKAFKFQLTLPPGKVGGRASRVRTSIASFLQDAMNIVLRRDPNNSRELTIEITEDEFEEWVFYLYQQNVQVAAGS